MVAASGSRGRQASRHRQKHTLISPRGRGVAQVGGVATPDQPAAAPANSHFAAVSAPAGRDVECLRLTGGSS